MTRTPPEPLGPSRPMPSAAIFDMDGLLFDTERLCREAWRAVMADSGRVLEDGLFSSCVGRNSQDTRGIVMRALGEDFPYGEFTRKTRDWMMARMRESGPPEKEGASRLLAFLAEREVPIALATSTSESSARWMIERAGLGHRFKACAFGNEVTRGKPAPDIFLLAMGRLGVTDAGGCVVFEDSPAGIRAAHAAGMNAVFVPDMVEPGETVRALAWKSIRSLDEAASDGFYRDMPAPGRKETPASLTRTPIQS